MSLSHRCGEICLYKVLLRSCERFNAIEVWPLTEPLQPLDPCLFQPFCCAWDHCPDEWPTFSQALLVSIMLDSCVWCHYASLLNISILVLSVQTALVQKSCGLLRSKLANLSCTAMFFSTEETFSPGNPSKHLLSFFPIVLSWNLVFDMLTETCRVWNAALGFFWDSLNIA